MDKDQERENKEAEERLAKRNRALAKVKYDEENENLKKRSYTSFGKLILAAEKTNPCFSFGNSTRDVPIKPSKLTPGPIYNVHDRTKYKKANEWKIGSAERPPLYNAEKHPYFDHLYDAETDTNVLPKKWQRTIGCAPTSEERVKYGILEVNPGPGRYEPNIKPIKNKAPTYYFGEKIKTNTLMNITGTNEQVGPASYKIEDAAKTSIHYNPPQWGLPKAARRGLEFKKWTVDETYYVYKSCNTQIDSKKKSEPVVSIGNATREKESKTRGIYPVHMSKQPTKIRIQHPKFY